MSKLPYNIQNYDTHTHSILVEHFADIKCDGLGANTGWLTFSLANQLS